MKRIEKISSEVVYRDGYCLIRKDFVLHASGAKTHYHVVEKSDFVAVVPLTTLGETFLVKQYRYPVRSFSLEFPMGSLNSGENPEIAGRRELREETGLEVEKFQFLGAANPAHGSLNNKAYVFLATGFFKLTEPSFDVTENIEIVKVKMNEVDELIRMGKIIDGPTIFAKHLFDINVKNVKFKEKSAKQQLKT